MSIDLNDLSLKELKDLQSKVAKAIASYEDRQRKDALAQLEEKAREMGFSLAELTGAPAATKRKRSLSAPKYANPADPTETWTGRGRKPNWMVEALKAGKSPEDMLI